MDFLPQPKGSWTELNAKRQSRNNAFLIAGVALFFSVLIGVIYLIHSKLILFVKNFNIFVQTPAVGMWDNTFFRVPKDKINKDFAGAKFVDA